MTALIVILLILSIFVFFRSYFASPGKFIPSQPRHFRGVFLIAISGAGRNHPVGLLSAVALKKE
jgi:hypothetical protein